MIWNPSTKAIPSAAEAYISDKGNKAVLEAAINVDKPIVDLSAIRTGRSRQPAIAEQSRSIGLRAWSHAMPATRVPAAPADVCIDDGVVAGAPGAPPGFPFPPPPPPPPSPPPPPPKPPANPGAGRTWG